MAGGQERVLRRRIKTVHATQKITRAMELIAASQIVKAQQRLVTAAPYQKAISAILEEAASEAGDDAGRLLGVPDEPGKVLVLAIVADRGLAGAYSANVLRATERTVRAGTEKGVEFRIVTVGKKAPSYLRFRGLEIAESFSGFSDRPGFEDARAITRSLAPAFLDETVDQVLVVSTRFLSAGSQVVESRQVLPLPESTSPEGSERAAPGVDDDVTGRGTERLGYTEFEPEAADLLVELVPRYVEAFVFGALLEAAASEHTARQRAMAAATDNADELVKSLTRVMNRARQDAITTEIMEIVGGAEALRQAAEVE